MWANHVILNRKCRGLHSANRYTGCLIVWRKSSHNKLQVIDFIDKKLGTRAALSSLGEAFYELF